MNAFASVALVAAVLGLGGCAGMGGKGMHGAGMSGGQMDGHHAQMCTPEMQARMKAMHEKKHGATGAHTGMHGHMQCHPQAPQADKPQGEAHKH
jgi:hypothetical protein